MKKKILAVLLALLTLFSMSSMFTVSAAEVDEVTFNLIEENLEIYKGTTAQLIYIAPEGATVSWSSSAPSVVSVDQGNITAIAEGTATITAVCGTQMDTCTVTVLQGSIGLGVIETSVYAGSTVKLLAEASNGATLKFTSGNPTIAKVDSEGMVTGLKSGTAYITVSALGCNDRTVTVHVVNKNLAKPSVSNTRTAAGIKVSWGKVTGASKYELWKRVGTSGTWKKIKTTTSLSYTDKDIAYGKTYYYRVKALGTSHELSTASAYSSNSSRKVSSIPKPTTINAKTASSTSIKITWSRVYPAKGYEIYRSTSLNGTYKKIATVSGGATLSYKNTGLKTGTKYYYKVRAISGTTKGSFSSKDYATPTLLAPNVVSASATKSTITVKWEKVSGASGYYVYRKSSSSGSWTKIATVKGSSTIAYKDTGRSGKYYYSVKAYKSLDGKKITGNRSATLIARTLKATTISVDRYNNTFAQQVTWSKVTGATGYQVYKKVGDNGSWTRVATTSKLSYNTEVPHGKWHYWKVRPIFKNDGKITYGPFSEVKNYINYWNPNYNVWQSSEWDSSVGSIFINVTNNGKYTMRIYSDGAWYNDSSSVFDRDLKLIDTTTFSRISYIDIPAGETVWVGFDVVGDNTFYDPDSYVNFKFRYDGAKFWNYSKGGGFGATNAWYYFAGK